MRLKMNAFDTLRQNKEIRAIIDRVNEMNGDIFYACHSWYHVEFVVKTAEYILRTLDYDERVVEAGKVAALLHDIGNIAGRTNHAHKSAALAAVFMENIADFTPEEKAEIIQAIKDHTDGKDVQSAVGAALLIADKIDVCKERLIPVPVPDLLYNELKKLDYASINIANDVISINFDVREGFDKALLVREYRKSFVLPTKAAELLGCECRFLYNGEKYNWQEC